MSAPNTIPAELSLIPPRRNPFYIVSPSYTHQSAGIKALHLLCHSLNRLGQLAFLVKQDFFEVTPFQEMILNPDWLTPALTREVYASHVQASLTPIVVYPETITGNPLKAAVVVRYVLNFPGLLGGDKEYPPEEIVFAYSKKLAVSANVGDDRVLFIPASDTNTFYRSADDHPRTGTCFYADKYKKVHNGELFEVTRNSLEITRGIGSQTTAEVAEIFRRSELFYCYENSALAIEAMLCGCPTVFLPNEHLTEIIASEELGMDGFAWGDSAAEIERARNTVDVAFESYVQSYSRFWQQLDQFIQVATSRAVTQENTQGLVNLDQSAPAATPEFTADGPPVPTPVPQPAAMLVMPPEPETSNSPPKIRHLPRQLSRRIRKNSLLRKPRRLVALLIYCGLLFAAYQLGLRG